ncbi:MAG: hypothetical protein WC712_06015 [Candidatus Brocadiia bacterium]
MDWLSLLLSQPEHHRHPYVSAEEEARQRKRRMDIAKRNASRHVEIDQRVDEVEEELARTRGIVIALIKLLVAKGVASEQEIIACINAVEPSAEPEVPIEVPPEIPEPLKE